VKKSKEVITDEVWRELQMKLVRSIRNDLVHSRDLGHGKTELTVRIEESVLAELRKRFTQSSLLQDGESKTETAKSFASMARGSETVNSLPPKNAEFLLALFLNKEDQEAATGCFAELYSKRVVRWGKSRALLWAWIQVGKTLVSVLKRVVLKVSGLIAAYEWLKHHLS
jgi:hypothetical protein